MRNTNSGTDKNFYKSKKFWVTILTILTPFINKIFDIELVPGELFVAIFPGVAYVCGLFISESKDNSSE